MACPPAPSNGTNVIYRDGSGNYWWGNVTGIWGGCSINLTYNGSNPATNVPYDGSMPLASGKWCYNADADAETQAKARF